MNERECLDAIAAGNSAESLLLERLPKARVKWNRLCKHLRTFIAEVNAEFPDANYYTASGGFNLLLGASHGKRHGQPAQPELLALGSIGVEIGDGDF
jgi:hypothetical protein